MARLITHLNTAVKFRRSAESLRRLGRPVQIGFEATGIYHRTLAHFLIVEGSHLERIASVAVAGTREGMHNSWDKNDPKDTQVVLHLLRAGFTQHFHDPLANQIHDVQELSLTYAQVSLEKTPTQHRLLTHPPRSISRRSSATTMPLARSGYWSCCAFSPRRL